MEVVEEELRGMKEHRRDILIVKKLERAAETAETEEEKLEEKRAAKENTEQDERSGITQDRVRKLAESSLREGKCF